MVVYKGRLTAMEDLKEVKAIAKIREEMAELDRYESAMVCGMISIMEYTIQQDESLQDAVLASSKSALGCLYGMLAVMAKSALSQLELEPVAAFGKITWSDLSKKAVKEIVNLYYKGE